MIIFLAQDISKAAHLLKKGELVAFPTETVYGLGASLSQEEALQKIYLAKGRPSDNPLIVHLAEIEDVFKLAVDIPDIFWVLTKAFSPGPLTFILRKNPLISSTVSAGLDTIALRFPAHPLARELIKQLGSPIAAPSANLSGRPSGTLPSHIIEDFEGKIGGVIDGGETLLGLESTVINLLQVPPVILRPGTITKEEIEEVLGQKILDKVTGDKILSPGMKYRHYAPKASLKLFTEEEAFHSYLSLPSEGKRAILARENKNYTHFFSLSGQALYATLRKLDYAHFDEIAVFCDSEIIKNVALMNRLCHAAQG